MANSAASQPRSRHCHRQDRACRRFSRDGRLPVRLRYRRHQRRGRCHQGLVRVRPPGCSALRSPARCLGSAIGAWFAGPLADRHGRIAVMKIAAAIFFVSSIGTGLAWDIMALSVFRFLGGTAIGAASVIAPAYIAEVSPAAYRGRLGSLQQLAIVTGIFIALLSDFALARWQAAPKRRSGSDCRPGAGCSSPRPFLPRSMPASPA